MTVCVQVGTYAKAGGAGLCTLHPAGDARWVAGGTESCVSNASFGVYSERHQLYYFVDEQPAGAVGVYRSGSGGLVQAARVATQGVDPCFIALDCGQRLLAVANYGSGSIALFRLDPVTGVPLEPPTTLTNSGSGPTADRQDGPHAHCACFSPDSLWLYHVDLGTDEILAYPIDPITLSIGEGEIAFRAPPGSGPRHLVFHPVLPLGLLASELASTLTVLQIAGSCLSPTQTISTLPGDFAGHSICGHLSLNAAGDRAYVTNRGHDSVSVFGWDGAGVLTPLQYVASGGASPRAFVLLEAERQMLLANEQDGTVMPFALQPDGTLSQAASALKVPGAAFPFVMAG